MIRLHPLMYDVALKQSHMNAISLVGFAIPQTIYQVNSRLVATKNGHDLVNGRLESFGTFLGGRLNEHGDPLNMLLGDEAQDLDPELDLLENSHAEFHVCHFSMLGFSGRPWQYSHVLSEHFFSVHSSHFSQ